MVCFASGVLLYEVAREVFYGDFVEVKLPKSQFFNSERVRMLSMHRICLGFQCSHEPWSSLAVPVIDC
jgi:hypothetical protein